MRYAHAFRNSPTATVIVDLAEHSVVAANRRACDLWEVMDSSALAGRTLTELLSLPETVLSEQLNPLTRPEGGSYYASVVTPAGKQLRALLLFSPMTGPADGGQQRLDAASGAVPGQAILSLIPIDEGRDDSDGPDVLGSRLEDQLEQERNNLSLMFDTAPVGLLLINDLTQVVKANRQLFRLLHRPLSDVRHRRFGNIFGCSVTTREGVVCGTAPDCHDCELRNGVLSVLENGDVVSGAELEHMFCVDGQDESKWLTVNASPVQLEGRRHALVSMDDITTRVVLEQRLKTLSYTDDLSGLRNRRAVLDALRFQLEQLAAGIGEGLSLAMMDIDDFKQINDEYGHVFGDQVISQVGRAILESIRATDVGGRYGGEEFLILLPGATPRQAQVVLARAQLALADHDFGVPELRVTLSGGVIGIDQEGARNLKYTELVDMADEVMYAAKSAGKDRILLADGGPAA